MRQKVIYIFLAFLAIGICAIIVIDFNSNQSKQAGGNPYALDLEAFREVDPALIQYNETRNIRLQCEEPRSIFYAEDRLYILADQYLQIIDPNGNQLLKTELTDTPECVYTSADGSIYVGFRNYIGVYNGQGQRIRTWPSLGEDAYITALVMRDTTMFVADAGNRCVHQYSTISGEVVGIIEGKTSMEDIHGFIVPSPTFDLAVNAEGELWVVNPGKHSFENYADDGKLRTYWENSSAYIDGFTGCCNPAHLALLPDGSFVTSEKKLVRIKIHKPSGELSGVVAAPDKFWVDGQAPDITVSPDGKIYALDLDQKMVRVFEKNLGCNETKNVYRKIRKMAHCDGIRGTGHIFIV